MQGTDMIDLSDKTCGLIPSMQQALESSAADELAFRVRSGVLLEIVSALGTGSRWTMRVEEGPESSVVRFSRNAPRPGDDLNLI